MKSRVLTVIMMAGVLGVSAPVFAEERADAAPQSAIAAGGDAASVGGGDDANAAEAVKADAAHVDSADAAQGDDVANAPDNDPDATTFPRRLELATEMHRLRPAAEQIDAAVDSIARQLPQDQAGQFRANIGNLLNYRVIEKISINAMAETFSVEELEIMVEYYSKPEVAGITQKYSDYQEKVGPEIVRMIDRAIMRMRTGDAGQ